MNGLIDITASRRMVRGLYAMGHSAKDIAAAAGWDTTSRNVLRLATHEPQHWVTPRVAQGVARAYDKLAMVVGTNELARAYARRLRYPPPLAWDDDTIGDPDARPHTVKNVAGRSRAAQVTMAREMYREGREIPQIAQELEVTERTAQRYLMNEPRRPSRFISEKEAMEICVRTEVAIYERQKARGAEVFGGAMGMQWAEVLSGKEWAD